MTGILNTFFILSLTFLLNNVVIGDDSERITYKTPIFSESDSFFTETFDNKFEFTKIWIKSEAKKDTTDEALSKYDGEWVVEPPQIDSLPGDLGLVLKSKAKHAALAAYLRKPFVFSDNPLIVQYEVTFQDGQECGGAYLKLLSHDKNTVYLKKFHDRTPYLIMFGPDKCGVDHKLHFIFRHKNPKNGSIEEKHCKKPSERIDDNFTDKKPHLYRLILNPDNTFKIYIDHNMVNSGSLLEDFTPSVNPPAEIDDPNDKKPSDWDEREKIPDLTASKPDDWDEDAPPNIEDVTAKKPEGWLDNEPIHIRDPFAEKPDDWDDEMDGEWEAPLVPNPACEEAPGCGEWVPPMVPNQDFKGKWHPPMIDNPNYQGKWTPRQIPNPDYFEDKSPFQMGTVGAVGFELWSISSNILFDNILITSKEDIADKMAAMTFDLKKQIIEMDADTFVNRFVAFTNKHPWLWALYVVILLIPITLIVVFCFGSKEKDLLAEGLRKKTDEAEPDDQNEYTTSVSHDELSNNSSEIEGKGPGDVDLSSSAEYSSDVVSDAHASELVDDESTNIKEVADIKNEEEKIEAENESFTSEDIHDPSPRKRCQRID